jgi:hypothetical protein
MARLCTQKRFQIRYVATSLIVAFMMGGCASNQQNINPLPSEYASYSSVKDEAMQEIYKTRGYEIGKRDGFIEGINWAKTMIKQEFIPELRSIQLASYLIKENYIQPGAVYFSENNQIELGCMEMKPPYTVDYIFSKFSDQIPKFVSGSPSNNVSTQASSVLEGQSMYSNQNTQISANTSSGAIDRGASKMTSVENDFTPDKREQKLYTGIVKEENIRPYMVQMVKTQTTLNLMRKHNISYGLIDNYYVARFHTKQDANDFCMNFDVCIGY